MARPTQDIKQIMLDAILADPILSNLNSTSQTAIYNLYAFVIAQSLNYQEQLWDIFKEELELIALEAVPGTGAWWKNVMLSFQYGDVIQLIDFKPVYPVLDVTKRIITRCSVTQDNSRKVTLKVAKGADQDSLTALSNTELNATKDYVNVHKFSGTAVSVISLNADRLYVVGDVYYAGQYVETTVKNNVKQAIKDYCATLEFNGQILKSGIEDAIQKVAGVKDVNLHLVKGRAEQTALLSGGAITIDPSYITQAGYIIPEDTSGYTLDDTINMILF